jgi:hypothetical protein
MTPPPPGGVILLLFASKYDKWLSLNGMALKGTGFSTQIRRVI